MRMTSIENGHKIQLPADWAAELGLEKVVELEKTADGILVTPASNLRLTPTAIHGKVPVSNLLIVSIAPECTRQQMQRRRHRIRLLIAYNLKYQQ